MRKFNRIGDVWHDCETGEQFIELADTPLLNGIGWCTSDIVDCLKKRLFTQGQDSFGLDGHTVVSLTLLNQFHPFNVPVSLARIRPICEFVLSEKGSTIRVSLPTRKEVESWICAHAAGHGRQEYDLLAKTGLRATVLRFIVTYFLNSRRLSWAFQAREEFSP